MSVRRVCYHPDFDKDAIHLGGVSLVQRAISPLVDALERRLPIFRLLEINANLYYAPIRASLEWPELIVTFVIDADDDAIMMSIDRKTSYS